MKSTDQAMAFMPADDTALITHDFPLRPNLIIRMTLPVGFNSDDLARLTGYLRTLAFDAVVPAKGQAQTDPGGDNE